MDLKQDLESERLLEDAPLPDARRRARARPAAGLAAASAALLLLLVASLATARGRVPAAPLVGAGHHAGEGAFVAVRDGAEADEVLDEDPTFRGFAPIAGEVDQSPTSIVVDLGCVAGKNPRTVVTIVPSDAIEVSTTPANLVTTSSRSNTLRLLYNKDAITDENREFGVKIGFPAGQLRRVSVRSHNTVQVLDGFTSVERIGVDSHSTVRATFTALGTAISGSVNSHSWLNMKSNAKVSATVNSQSNMNVGAPQVDVDVNSHSTLNVDGDVGSGGVSSHCTLSVTGDVTGRVSVNSHSNVYTSGDCWGASTNSQSSCHGGRPVSVDVDVSEMSPTGTGHRFGYCAACVAGDTPLWSCTEGGPVRARDVSIGDSVRAVDPATGKPSCSDVYYVFRHGEESHRAIRFHLKNGNGDDNDENGSTSSLAVSYNHIVYVGTSFEGRRPVLSQDVKPGDRLVTGDGDGEDGGVGAEVVGIDAVDVDLVNVLTIAPHLEIQTDGGGGNNVVVSAHSYEEAAYGALFAPVRYVYRALGPAAVEYMKPIFDGIDASLARPSIRNVADKLMLAK